jgi:hypothetical protein
MPFTVSTVTDFATRPRTPAVTVLVATACAVVALMLIGARPHEAPRAAVPSAATASPQPRTNSERAWNEMEDLKAARYVGQPGIY